MTSIIGTLGSRLEFSVCDVCKASEPSYVLLDVEEIKLKQAEAARDLLAPYGLPAGWPAPEVYPGEVYITREMIGRLEPDQAIAYAAALLRGALEARSKA